MITSPNEKPKRAGTGGRAFSGAGLDLKRRREHQPPRVVGKTYANLVQNEVRSQYGEYQKGQKRGKVQ